MTEEGITDKLRKALLENGVNRVELMEEVWEGLSRIYYKYEFAEWRTAFLRVMQDIAGRIADDNWKSVYDRLYREEKKG